VRGLTVGIDIPIGLPDQGERQADRLARARVGKRWPSVFMTPPRRLLTQSSYESAMAAARSEGAKGLSRQAYAIGPRIVEAERAIGEGWALHEVHPEVSFAAMADGPLDWAKVSYRGAIVRRQLLKAVGIRLPDDLGEANGVPTDDVLDAAAAAWSAARIATGEQVRLPDPPEVFSDGLPAAICF
jgi:predicted RNase H-like nuclease